MGGGQGGGAYLDEFLPEIGIKPPVQDRVADTGAHGDDMAETEGEKVDFGGWHLEEAEIGDSEEEMKRKRGDDEGDSNAGEDEGHPLVSLALFLPPLSIQSLSRVLFQK